MKAKAASVVVINEDGLVLSVKRKKNDLIGIPCGKIEPGEHPVECAVRELEEETGIELVTHDLVYVGTFETVKDYYVSCFWAPVRDYYPTDKETPVKWVTWDDLIDPIQTPWPEFNKLAKKSIEDMQQAFEKLFLKD